MPRTVKPEPSDLTTPEGRLAHAEAVARETSEAFRQREAARREHGRAGHLDLFVLIDAQRAVDDAHQDAIREHFGWMPDDDVLRRQVVDLAEEVVRRCDEELERRRRRRGS